MRRHKGRDQETASASESSTLFPFICCECNALLSNNDVREKRLFVHICPRGHSVSKRRPKWLALLQGFGWGTLLMSIGVVLAIVDRDSNFAVLGIAGAVCSAFACLQMLNGIQCRKLGEPATSFARQRFWEAIGLWLSIIMSTLVTAR
jgi:hypothetical protein